MLKSVLLALVFGSLSTFALAPSAIAQGAAQSTDILPLEGVAAVVNDEPISYYDVRQRVAMLAVTLGAEPTQEVLQQLAGTALEQLVDERLQLQLAAEFELEISSNEIAASVDRIAQQAGSNLETLAQQFHGAGITMRTLEEQVRADIAWRRIMSGRYGSRIRISRNQINDQMNRLRSSAKETSYQLAEIFLFAPDDENKIQAQIAANSLVEQLRSGTPFQAAAQQFSSSPTASTGGDMGWVSVEDLPRQVAEAVSEATRTGVLEPIVADNGIYIISVRGKREPEKETTKLEMMQIVAVDNDLETLESAMDRVDGCESLHDTIDDEENMIMGDLGTVKLTELNGEAQDRVKNLTAGDISTPFEASRGLSAIVLCDRKDDIEGLPSDDQLENQLFGRELNMISERELRNARLEATILRQQ